MRWLALLLCVVPMALGCVGGQFDAARREDTAAAYHRFLREHPDSQYSDEARQRLAIARLRSKPTAKAWDAFNKKWPDSPLRVEAGSIVEQALFERTRAQGSVDAYRSFLEEFEYGAFELRAQGNLAYLEAGGFGGKPDALAAFAKEHPESDFAVEAKRTAELLRAFGESRFRQVGLVLSISASTPGKDRLARVFTERAAESLQRVGVQVVPLSGADDPRAAALPVRLTVRHEEGAVKTKLSGGTMSSAGILVKTTVTLARDGEAEPIWSRTTSFKAPAKSTIPDTSVVFAAGTQRYWESFFIPVATWNTRTAVRSPYDLAGRLVAVESQGDRGFALSDDGSFTVIDLSDPENPWPFARYQRPRDLATFGGLRVVGGRAVVFGEDGLEVVSLEGAGPTRQRALDRGTVGQVVAVEPVKGGFAVASQRGLLFVPEKGDPQVVLARPVRGMAKSGDWLVFTDGGSIFVATLAQLRQGRVQADLPLGPGVRPSTIRVAGRVGVVLSAVGALRLDLRDPSAPKIASRIDAAEAGALQDVALVGGRIFLLGERGLQVSDRRGARVIESADVAARASLDRMGRHLVMVGDRYVQVVDATPFLVSAGAAARN